LIADWIGAASTLVAALIAAVAAWIGLRAYKDQRTTSDVGLALSIFGEINHYWDRLSEDSGKYEYNMGQILAQFEIAAALFNNRILTKDANVILADHIVEVFTQLNSTTEGETLIERCCSSPSTFKELRSFVNERMPQALNSLDFKTRRTWDESLLAE
jgi:hypothetical protein